MTAQTRTTNLDNSSAPSAQRSRLQYMPQRLLHPIPLVALQPLLQKVITRTALQRPELFKRLGSHSNKRFLIDPENMPFSLLLCPDPVQPKLRAYRRSHLPEYDARITGTFLTLLDMIDGRLDGDALFFTRELVVEGDTEATVVLRNALDDLEGSIVEEIVTSLGFFAAPVRLSMRALRRIRR